MTNRPVGQRPAPAAVGGGAFGGRRRVRGVRRRSASRRVGDGGRGRRRRSGVGRARRERVERRAASPRCAPASSRSSRRRSRRPAARNRGTIAAEVLRARRRRRTGPRSAAAGRRSAGSSGHDGSSPRSPRHRLERLEAGLRATAAVDPDDVGAGRRAGRPRPRPGGVPSGSCELLAERELGDDRAGRRRARASSIASEEVAQSRERLEDEQVDAALEQAVDLLANGGPDLAPRAGGAARGSARRAGRSTRRPGSRPATSRASRASWAPRRLSAAGPVAQPVGGEPDAVGAERRRLDELRAGVEVLAVDRADQLRAARDELVEVRPLRHAARVQQRAHRPVGEERAGGEPLGGSDRASFTGPRYRTARSGAPVAGRATRRARRAEEDLGGRGRPLYVEDWRGRVGAGIGDRDEVAATQRRQVVHRRANRSTRRSVPRRGSAPARPRRAVDASGRGSSGAGSGAARRTAPAGSARSCPASRTTWRPPRSRTWSTRATSQPARATR